jgi:hypothetical protein
MHQPAKNRAEIRRAYKESPRQAGVFLLGSSTNLHGPLNKHRFMLSIGRHDNADLQADWNRLGADAFVFEILEVVKAPQDSTFCLEDELTLLEQIWIEKLQLTDSSAYNRGPIRRD